MTHENSFGTIIITENGIRKTHVSVAATVKAKVMDTNALVEIEQSFILRSAGVAEAVYRFPLPPDAAVFSFEYTNEGKKVTGIVKEKDVAKKEFNEALEQGKSGALLQENMSDGKMQQMKYVSLFYPSVLNKDMDQNHHVLTLT